MMLSGVIDAVCIIKKSNYIKICLLDPLPVLKLWRLGLTVNVEY